MMRVQRRTQLVAHAREKVVLRAVRILELYVLFLQRALEALALGDVADRARDQHAFLRFERAQADFDREFGSVLAAAVEFQAHAHRTHARIAEEPLPMRRVRLPVALRQHDLDVPVDQLLARVAEELFGLRVRNDNPAGAVHDEHRIGRRFEQGAEFLLRLPAAGDVADRAHDERVLVRVDRVQADLDGKLAAVLAPPIELGPRAHFPHARMREIARAITDMLLAVPLRQQALDRRAPQLFATVAEHVLRACVGDDDAAAAIDHHDAVGHRLEQAAKACFEPLRVAHDLQMRDVLVRGQNPLDGPLGATHRLARDVDVNDRAVLAAAHRLVCGEIAIRSQSRDDAAFFLGAVGGNEEIVYKTRDGLAPRIAENRFRALAPVDDAAIGRRRDDRVRGLVQQQLVKLCQHSGLAEREYANRLRDALQRAIFSCVA